MRYLASSIIFIATCFPVTASITATTASGGTSLSYRLRGGNVYPITRNLFPPKNGAITVVSSGSWTVAVGGSLNTACLFSAPCFNMTGPFNGTPVTSGAMGTSSINVNFNASAIPVLAASGTPYTGTITFTQGANTAVVNVSITVVDATLFPTFGEFKTLSQGAAAGCSMQTSQGAPWSGNEWSYNNLCPITSEAPYSALPSVIQPALGGSYIDPQFGGNVTRVGAAGSIMEYGGISPISTNNTYITISDGVHLISNPSTIVRTISPYNIINVYPSALLDNSFYAINGTVIDRRDYVTPATVHLVDLSISPYFFRDAYEGGTQGNTEDDWQVFFDRGTTTSATSLAVGTGSKTFVTGDGNGYDIGAGLSLTNGGNSMTGLVTASSGANVTFNVTMTTGSGTVGSWTVSRYNPRICAINLPQLESDVTPGNGNIYCANWSSATSPQLIGALAQSIDWVQVLDIDRPTGNRYVYMVSNIPGQSNTPPNAGNTLFHVGATGSGQLIQDLIIPELPGQPANNDDGICQAGELCLVGALTAHGVGCVDSDGQAWMYWPIADSNTGFHSAWMRLSAGAQMVRPIEEGGGLKLVRTANWDVQPGCSSRSHAWALSGNGTDPSKYAALITAASYSAGGNTVTLTFASIDSSLPSWTGSEPLIIQNATGSWTPLNGLWASSNYVSGNTMTVSCPGCSVSSGSPGATAIVADSGPLSSTILNTGDRSQFGVMKPGRSYNRIATNRTVQYLGVTGCWPDTYTSTSSKGAISRDGKLVAFMSNYGSLDCAGPSAYIATTGMDYTLLSNMTIQPAETSALLTYRIGDGSACSTDIASDSGFGTIIRTVTDAAGPVSRQTPLGTLTAATNYWTRTTCGQNVDATYFTTLASGTPSTQTINTGIGAPTVAGATKVVLEHQTDVNTGAWTAVASVPCATGGSGCTVSWAADNGHVNWQRFRFQNVSSVDLAVTAPTAINASR